MITSDEAMVYASAAAKGVIDPEEAVRRYRMRSVTRQPEPHNAPHPSGLNRAQRRARGIR